MRNKATRDGRVPERYPSWVIWVTLAILVVAVAGLWAVATIATVQDQAPEKSASDIQ